MTSHLKLDDRLSVLRAEDRFRTWSSLDDERLCIICKRKFNGRQVEIRRFGNRKYELRCPTEGCNSRPHLWIYRTTPLVSHWTGGVLPMESTNAVSLSQRCGRTLSAYDR